MFILDGFSDFVEKAEKLLLWQDQETSGVFLFGLILAFFVVTFLPLRYFVIIGCKLQKAHLIIVLMKFRRGQTYYQRRFVGN